MYLVLVSACAVSSAGAQAPAVPQSQIDAAIDRGIAYLLDVYHDGEGRDPREKPGSPTALNEPPGLRALTLYALLKSGVSARDPVVEKLVSRLAFERLSSNYDVSCMLLALVALDPLTERSWIGDLAAFLVQHQEKAGDFGYPGGGDLSNTQFVAFALHAAVSAGVEVPPRLWKDLASAVMRYHAKDGGFGYMANTPSTNTMTAAGVGVLSICEIELARASALDPELAQTIRRGRAEGLAWLALLPSYGTNSDRMGWLHYFLYGIERVGDLSTIETIGDHDWYNEGAAYLVEAQDDRGAWHGNYDRTPTLFALLFLARANAAVRTGERFAPRTGPRPKPFQHTAGSDVAGGARLDAEGSRPLRMWVTRLSSPANAAFEWPEGRGRGPHVAYVEFLIDDVPVEIALGDPERPAGDRRFACEHSRTAPGHHRLTARIHVCPPEARDANGQRSAHGAGEQSPAHADEVITTNGVEIDVDEGAPVAIIEKSFDPDGDLVLAGHAHATASSTLSNVPGWDQNFGSRFVVDGNPRSVWIASQEDEHPLLKVRLQEPQRASVVRIAIARLEPRTPDFLNLPQEISVSIDGGTAKTMAIESSTRVWYELPLGSRRMVSSIDVRLIGRQARNATVGIGEVALFLEPK
jgi:hypothetical protein